MRNDLTYPVALLALTLVASAARAADGRIPISAVPMTLSAPGVYYLTQDLTVASGVAVAIGSSRVTLDLNGHTLTNTSLAAGDMVIALSSGASFTGVRVTNGNLVGGSAAIDFGSVNGGEYQVDHLDVTGSGTYGIALFSNAGASPATHAVVESVRVLNCVGSGIYLQNVTGSRVSNCSVRSCSAGLTLLGSRGVLVEGNVFAENSAQGVNMLSSAPNFSRDNTITGNTIQQNGGIGINLSAATRTLVNRNTVAENGNAGISLSSASNFNSITDNLVAGNTLDGIYLAGSTNSSISRNTVSGTTGAPGEGIHFQSNASFNVLDWNIVSGNAGAGINLSDTSSTGVIYSYNRFSNNGAANTFGVSVSAGGNNQGAANF